ncbi:hypothetical protein [Dactylosporangium sp. NPDC048998]|uniref:hypothetical protein n=1 Tax=Dactylosporangium sp. NPDC048998 TaxID=3363976 RepID=UPI003723E9D7
MPDASPRYERAGFGGRPRAGARKTLILGAMGIGVLAPAVPVLVGSVRLVAVLVVLVGAWLLALVRAGLGHRRFPAAFTVDDETAFQAPPAVQFSYFAAGWPLCIGAFAVIITDPEMPRPVGASDWASVAFLAVMAVFVLVYATVVIVAGLTGRPYLRLTPAGVQYANLAFDRFIPWQALCPDSAVTVSRFTVTVHQERPELLRRRRPRSGSPRLTFSVGYVRIRPQFAAAAIRFYLQHPEERPAIGTPDGYARLNAAVRGGRTRA